MFTIIICNKDIKEAYENRFSSFINPLKDDRKFKILEWIQDGDGIEETVPGLKELVLEHKQWRAIIVASRNADSKYELERSPIVKRNPFDFVTNMIEDYESDNTDSENKSIYYYSDIHSIDDVETFNSKRIDIYNKVAEEPLIKLTNWLSKPRIIDYETPIDPMVTEDKMQQYANEEELNYPPSNPNKSKAKEESFKNKYFKEALLNKELVRLRIERDRIIKNKFYNDSNDFVDYAANEIILISERAVKQKDFIEDFDDNSLELNYSQFAFENLYPKNTKFIVFDTKYSFNNHRNDNDFLTLLVFVNVLAANPEPKESLQSDKLYKANVKLSFNKIKRMFDEHISKLNYTLKYLDKIKKRHENRLVEDIDNNTVFEKFIEGTEFNIALNNVNNNLYCESHDLGFYTDHLIHNDVNNKEKKIISEKEYWGKQIEGLRENFAAYFREPFRRIKTEASGSFRKKNKISDSDISRMNEFQNEDVTYNSLNEEEKMVNIGAESILPIKEYKKSINDIDNEIKERISHRSKKTIVILSVVVSVSLFFLGSILYLFIARNETKGTLTSFMMILLFTGIFLFAAFLILYYLRYTLQKLFRKFNDNSTLIIKDIDKGLKIASEYLTHACNTMRGNSVNNYYENYNDYSLHIIKKHKYDIEQNISDTVNLLPNVYKPSREYIDVNNKDFYEYDYMKVENYKYGIPTAYSPKEIEYLQKGNFIEVPVDYIESIELDREEIYEQYK